MNAYKQWWDLEGSGMCPHEHEDCEEFAMRITEIAWSNAQFVEREGFAKFFEEHWREEWTDLQIAAAIRARGQE